MLSLSGIESKNYWEVLGRGCSLPPIPCPCCGELLRPRGWHRRYLDGERVELRRVGCPLCGVTHVVLPEDVCAYRDLKLAVVETVLGQPGGPTMKARACGDHDGATVRRVRRLVRAWGEELLRPLEWLLPGPGSWWERVRAAFGNLPGTLIRLRRWLWSRARYFVSGLGGLYRDGRPRFVVGFSQTLVSGARVGTG
jgi:hypothetical protein